MLTPHSSLVGTTVFLLAMWASHPAFPSRISYDAIPAYGQLSPAQQELLSKTDATELEECQDTGASEECWDSLNLDQRATFFMISYVLEKTKVNGQPLIELVGCIEGILTPGRVEHLHVEPAGSTITAEVDGWRMHLCIGVSKSELVNLGWSDDGSAHHTHEVFGFVRSTRDRRSRQQGVKGPFLQLVLDDGESASDSDLDKGTFVHSSSPLDVYNRLIERYEDDKRLARIYIVSRGN